ncbi:hypothetical protein EV189_0062 [Motilibacter rhizosphaerae]|uniref:Uncharacterized protein n=1 Tax=Motilibacter rhizosphaerae TaxID=598652 RepID=A0A4Q7NUG3_9ACTN|nr:hypothetical protein [Motilibacter rhizosphaerae]RZS90833.1 hypothetical protein EV189_0062 [Motilibacter rhizosphaerae]
MQEHQSAHSPLAAPPSGVLRRAFLKTGAAAAAGVGLGLGVASPAYARTTTRPGIQPFGPVTITDSQGASYARGLRLSEALPGQSGTTRTTLATYQQFAFGKPGGFQIYRSDDDGRTWAPWGTVGAGAGRVWLQPFLYELPRPFAGLPQGAILAAGNSLDFSSTKIVLYASTDHGKTFTYLSTVAVGGAPNPTNGFTPVWEPFLLLNHDRLVCYYSDQRDPLYGQKLAHQTSTDLVTWGPVVNDAVGDAYANRPGMTTIARIAHHKWIMTYEYGVSDTYYPVRYKIASDPEEFGDAPSIALVDQDGYAPSSAPYVSWADFGGPDGTIIVSANSDADFFLNKAGGDPGAWTRLSTPMPRSYSRFSAPIESPGSLRRTGSVLVISGAPYGASAPIQAGVIQLP